MHPSRRRTAGRALARALPFALLAAPAAPSLAGSFGVCSVNAKIASMEPLSLWEAGSRRLSSEGTSGSPRSDTFQTLVTLQVLGAHLIDGKVDCGRRMQASDAPPRFILAQPVDSLQVGAEVTLMWEYFIDVTPDGNIYQERWTLSNGKE
jgi:hypothetical protein